MLILLLLALVVGQEPLLPGGLRACHLSLVGALRGGDGAQDVRARRHTAVVVRRPRGGAVAAIPIGSGRGHNGTATKVIRSRPRSSATALPIGLRRPGSTIVSAIIVSGRFGGTACGDVAALRHGRRTLVVSRSWPRTTALLGIAWHRCTPAWPFACCPRRRRVVLALVVRLRGAVCLRMRWSVRWLVGLASKERLLSLPQLCVMPTARLGLLPPDIRVWVVWHLGRQLLTVERSALLRRPR